MLFMHIGVGILFIFLAAYYKEYYFKKDIRVSIKNPQKLIKANQIMIFTFIGSSIVTGLIQKNSHVTILASFEYLFLLSTVWLMSEIDYKQRVIPNFLVLLLFISRLIFLVVANYQVKDFIDFMPYSPLVGFLVGGGVLFVSKIISRNGIGFGDVKMFAGIGFYLGENGIFQVLFYTFILTALVGLGLLFFKKLSYKDSLPLAPFAFLGLAIYFPLFFINW